MLDLRPPGLELRIMCLEETVSSHSSHHSQEVLLAQFSLYVHKGGLKPDSFHLAHFLFRIYMNTDTAVEGAAVTCDVGDLLRCGFVTDGLKYDRFGIPECNQMLQVYFSKNGHKVSSTNRADSNCKNIIIIIQIIIIFHPL